MSGPVVVGVDHHHEQPGGGHRTTVTLRFDLPGVELDDVDVAIEGSDVMVRATRPLVEGRPDARLCYEHDVSLNRAIDTRHVRSGLRDGILTVTLPLSSTPVEGALLPGGERARSGA